MSVTVSNRFSASCSNPGFPTIEEELCKALVKTELIGQEHSDDMKLVKPQSITWYCLI